MEKPEAVKERKYPLSKAEVDKLKAKHERVFVANDGDKYAYLKVPDRKIIRAANAASKDDTMKFNDVIIENCWIEGDEDYKKVDRLYLGLSRKLDRIIDIADVELKEL